MKGRVFVGCAGWSIPREWAERFPPEGSHLERYARVLPAVEINSSFYRSHARATYERWRRSVPPAFRFAVKAPRVVTHTQRLRDARAPLTRLFAEATGLGRQLGLVLVQLPPSLGFEAGRAEAFLQVLRRLHRGGVALEPRHGSWFDGAADGLLERYRVARVAADPAPVPDAGEPGGWRHLVYFRLHGSPRMYHSSYSDRFLAELGERIDGLPRSTSAAWCVFDNTAAGAATGNALRLTSLLSRIASPPPAS